MKYRRAYANDQYEYEDYVDYYHFLNSIVVCLFNALISLQF